MFEALKKSELEEFSVKFSDQDEEGGFFLNVDGVSKMSESNNMPENNLSKMSGSLTDSLTDEDFDSVASYEPPTFLNPYSGQQT